MPEPVGESLSETGPASATSHTPAVNLANLFEVTKTFRRPRLSSAYYDLGTGISNLK